jgi:hypothetical protein
VRPAAEAPVFPAKARARFEPAYPRVTRVAAVEVPDRAAEPPAAVGRRCFPEFTNTESLRGGFFGGGSSGGAASGEGLPGDAPRLGKVVDAATGKPMRERRGLECDHLTLAHVPRLTRWGQDGGRHDPDVVAGHHRGGIGFSTPADAYYKTVEFSNNFFSDKPARWYSDPTGRPVRVAFVGERPPPGLTQAEANKAAMAALSAASAAQARPGTSEAGAYMRARPSTSAANGRRARHA